MRAGRTTTFQRQVDLIDANPISSRKCIVGTAMSDKPEPGDDLMSMGTIARYSKMIEDLRAGLDPEIIKTWYEKVESDARDLAPANLKETIEVIQDDLLPMKYNFKASKRAVPFVVEAIEKNLQAMPFATRLYFQKVEESIWEEYERYAKLNPSP